MWEEMFRLTQEFISTPAVLETVAIAAPVFQAAAYRKIELRDEALKGLYVALRETEDYMVWSTIGKKATKRKRDRTRERELSILWRAAAIPISHIDPNFAYYCGQKHDYWTNPDKWIPPNPDVDDQTEIGNIRERIEQLRGSLISAFVGTRKPKAKRQTRQGV